MRFAVKLFDGFADPSRMSTLARGREMNVGELVDAVGATQPRVSGHLRCLAWCGYVKGDC